MGEKKGVSEILSNEFALEDMYGDGNRQNKIKRKFNRKKDNKVEKQKIELKIEVLKDVTIGEVLTVKELAEVMKKTATDVIKKFMGMGLMVTLNQEVDFDSAAIVAEEFGITAHKRVEISEEDILFDDTDDEEKDLESRPPVVTVMGHVDHGKTSLLDAIRETNIIEKEAGGITQHIGAYTVKIHDRIITFLDTPGHEAFTSMRARGAQVTDIAVLVVAADDGIMPQTIEAINHAKAANVTVIVAINKIDKVGANPDKVKQDLTSYGLVPEEWGGDIICVPVSAKKRMNIPQLLEMILLSADVMELKASKKKQAKGSIIEAKLDKNRGAVATVLIQRGTLNNGDTMVSGSVVGRIRAMTNDKMQKVKEAGPSTPVEILGLPTVPEAGDTFYVVNDEKVAKQLVEKRRQKSRELSIRPNAKISLDDLFSQIKEGKVKELNIIVRADVQGSVEAVKQSIEKLSNDEVKVKIMHGGVGAITKADVILAEVSNAIIIGFNVRPTPDVIELAKYSNVDVRLYRIIYNAIEDIQAAMKGLLDPKYKEQIQGHAEIRQLFKVSSIGTIGGCYILDGKISRNSEVRIVRNGVIVHEGKLSSLKRFKEDAKEVMQGYECGLSIEKFNDIKEGDIIESFEMVKVEE
jgi:translation initiation factor IF-2